MEEMLDKSIVRSLRIEKAWSQEQLAEISGLSLRTIQRVEKEGKCSLESVRALCCAFDVKPSDLSSDGESAKPESKGSCQKPSIKKYVKPSYLLIAIGFFSIAAFGFIQSEERKAITVLNQGDGFKSIETFNIDFANGSLHNVSLFDGYWLEATKTATGDTQYLFKIFDENNTMLHQSKTSLLSPVLYKFCSGKFDSFQSPNKEQSPDCGA